MRIFIGSAKESLSIAKELARLIEREHDGAHEVVLWDKEGLFHPARGVWDNLDRITSEFDAAIMVFGANDKAWVRGRVYKQPRDNALVEFGLFSGRLGVSRTAFCRPQAAKIPTDLDGIVHLVYNPANLNTLQGQLSTWLTTIISGHMPREATHAGLSPAEIEGIVETCVTGFRREPISHSLLEYVNDMVLGSVKAKFACNRLSRRVDLVVTPAGDGDCTIVDAIESPDRPVRLLPLGLKGDVVVPRYAHLNVAVKSLTKGYAISPILVSFSGLDCELFLRVTPELPVGCKLKYKIQWKWPGMWQKLVNGEPDFWEQPVRSMDPVPKIEISIKTPSGLRLAMADRDGRGVVLPDQTLPDGSKLYRWRATNAQGGDYHLALAQQLKARAASRAR